MSQWGVREVHYPAQVFYEVPVAEGDALRALYEEAQRWRWRQSPEMRSSHPDWALVQAVLAAIEALEPEEPAPPPKPTRGERVLAAIAEHREQGVQYHYGGSAWLLFYCGPLFPELVVKIRWQTLSSDCPSCTGHWAYQSFEKEEAQ